VSGVCQEVVDGQGPPAPEPRPPGRLPLDPGRVPHVVVNRTAMPAVFVGARTDPNEQESVVLRPHLDARAP
jgi:uncharacterized RmlC-like cupin family protein